MTLSDLDQALQVANEGDLPQAISAVRNILRREPKRVDALVLLGVLLQRDEKRTQALYYFEQAVSLVPHHPVVRTNYANALLQAGKTTSAIREYKKALQLSPEDQGAWHGLLMAQIAAKDRSAALEVGVQILQRWPDWSELAELHFNGLLEAGRVDDVLREAGAWLARRPADIGVLATYAYARNFRSDDPRAIAQTHLSLGRLLTHAMEPPRRDADPERPLRVGVLSGDLREHSVSYFLSAIVEGIPAGFSCVVFSTERAPADDLTAQRFREILPDWIEVGDLTGPELDQLIRAKEIDVLLELSGYTMHSRLHMLVKKPAPLIIHCIGYPNTTGFPVVDWRIVDSITDPPAEEVFGSERLLRIDPCFLCYQPPPKSPQPAFPTSEPIVFGSFNNDAKLSPETIRLWGRILAEVPSSRLLLKSRSLAEPANMEGLARRLRAGGLDPERIELLPFAPQLDSHLSLYGNMHVALDPTPYNGTTTTCEALWMGVPVVTLKGDRHVARVGATLLHAAGLDRFVAGNTEEYVAIAVSLARDLNYLRLARQSLRAQLVGSDLTNASWYANRFFAALREAWRDWCRKNGKFGRDESSAD